VPGKKHRAGRDITIAILTMENEPASSAMTPGLSHLAVLRLLDRTGLSPWLLGFGAMLVLTISAVTMLILARYPDPTTYKNSIAFCAIISFFVVFYFSMGRGWHRDLIEFIEFDPSLVSSLRHMEPRRITVAAELVIAAFCAWVNLQINDAIDLGYSLIMTAGVSFFYFVQYTMVVLSFDVIMRQLFNLVHITREIRIDLLNAEFYSSLANSMVRHVGLYIFGVCIIALSYIVFTEGELGAGEMMVLMMPWYLPGMIIISLYLLPYNQFRRRMHLSKQQELNSIGAALRGNQAALSHSLLKNEEQPTIINLLYYQDRIRNIREWPFTDRIRALVLFGVLPPLTWVIAALIEIMIESSL